VASGNHFNGVSGSRDGNGNLQGKYFNKVILDLRKHSPGTTLNEVLDWITTMHGFLSASKGGGIRHGTDIKKSAVTKPKPHEARLFCNLIRSYIRFLIDEHEEFHQQGLHTQTERTVRREHTAVDRDTGFGHAVRRINCTCSELKVSLECVKVS
jgi:hypothetical protein